MEGLELFLEVLLIPDKFRFDRKAGKLYKRKEEKTLWKDFGEDLYCSTKEEKPNDEK